MYRKVLVTLDRSELSEAALPELQKLLAGSPAEVTLLTVGEVPRATRRRRAGPSQAMPLGEEGAGVMGPAPPRYVETRDQAIQRTEDELREYLESLNTPIRETGSRVEVVARLGQPERDIVDFARRGDFDLIVMATHGRSGLSELVQGSIAEAVVRSGVAPVLLVRPRKSLTGRRGQRRLEAVA
jgi:nucleotide-binding universal stress UspA family protein